MLDYTFYIGTIASVLVLLYFLMNTRSTAHRIFIKLLFRNSKGSRSEPYMERFSEHKGSSISGNLFVQLLPWFSVLALFFVLSNQYIVLATVLSGSMEPTFKRGDLVLMQTIDRKAKVGDIVMFGMYGFKEPITHRVIDITERGIITQGDANPAPDSSGFPPERIAAKAVLIGNDPIVLKGAGYYIRPESIGEQTVLTKLPKIYAFAKMFDQFRTVQPTILFFGTIFYLLVLFESRKGQKRRFDRKGRSGIRNKTS